MTVTVEERFAIHDLYAEYAAAIDEFRLHDWLELFDEECSYRIVPRENFAAGLPLALVLCESKDMVRDRVVALLEANEFAIHTDRHLVSGIRFRGRTGDVVRVDADFAVFQSNSEGEGSVFAFGQYIDEVVLAGGRARFRSRVAVMDNSCVPHAISTPI